MGLPVTCIIPCHNGAATIERAVISALDAGCNAVCVYDDGSTDDTPQVLERLKKHFWIYTFSDPLLPKVGVNFARNYLVAMVDTGLIIPLDADDELRDITPLVEAWTPGTWVYGNYAEHDSGSITTVKGSAAGALPRKNITGITFLFHKDDWQKVGGYDPDFAYAEDYAFQCALTNAGVQPKYVDTVVYDRYLHPTGNERTARAGLYWNFYRDMARSKYPNVFAGTG